MTSQYVPSTVVIRPFEEKDATAVRDLFIVVNKELSPPGMRSAFEEYINRSLVEEVDRITPYYGERLGAFWVAVRDQRVVGMFGLEPASLDSMELRRMYVDPSTRRMGIAQSMLDFAESECRLRRFARLELSTSELQPAAIGLYKRAGYQPVREAVAEHASNKTIGGGIHRYYFEKRLSVG